jgi:hypothetical protein
MADNLSRPYRPGIEKPAAPGTDITGMSVDHPAGEPANLSHRHTYDPITDLCTVTACEQIKPAWLSEPVAVNQPVRVTLRVWWASLPRMVRWFLASTIVSLVLGAVAHGAGGLMPGGGTGIPSFPSSISGP